MFANLSEVVVLLKLLEGQVFGPSAVAAMVKAYALACQQLGIHAGEEHRLAELIARTVIEACEAGELDPEVLKSKAVAATKME